MRKAEPDSTWQSEQLQISTKFSSTSAIHVRWPQRHFPSTFICAPDKVVNLREEFLLNGPHMNPNQCPIYSTRTMASIDVFETIETCTTKVLAGANAPTIAALFLAARRAM